MSQMYLRRFGEHTGPRQYKLTARRIDNVDQPFTAAPNKVLAERGYYWGTTFDGIPHHGVEDLFTELEGATASVLRTVLDAPEGALPARWPLSGSERLMLSWWLAAQILRTTRQRKRLAFAAQAAERLDAPAEIAAIAANNPHLSFIIERLAALAFTLYARPWGLGFSDMCLLTSDVPVALFNHHDAEDQLTAAALCDILVPLDPHRLLFMPSPRMQADDPYKRADHRMKIPGAVGMALVQVAYDVADALVIHHPRHDPWVHWAPSGPRQPAPWNGKNHDAPKYVLEYGTLAPHLTVERHWLTEHPPASAKEAEEAPGIGGDATG
ncbi:DUF4238 domain-containing protein [Streptomyces melanosporofaciens]|uniref:DUF4238 domain-containing protein n=1 Tax=Streptomyces melanosporofaciens TaxID=67327 RepID=A0A1H4KR15_STRMJ|nr:DUF4238 domain-containing protein [Streptomyces melanosporofaciens]SEB60947.1 Protein of unknown function [Streptomyces melanosporofaciens]